MMVKFRRLWQVTQNETLPQGGLQVNVTCRAPNQTRLQADNRDHAGYGLSRFKSMERGAGYRPVPGISHSTELQEDIELHYIAFKVPKVRAAKGCLRRRRPFQRFGRLKSRRTSMRRAFRER